jgi:hypothetical protein
MAVVVQKVLGGRHGGRLRGLEPGRPLRAGHERQRARPRAVDRRDPGDLHGPVASQGAAQPVGQLAKDHPRAGPPPIEGTPPPFALKAMTAPVS